jgi:hypothetical protein
MDNMAIAPIKDENPGTSVEIDKGDLSSPILSL